MNRSLPTVLLAWLTLLAPVARVWAEPPEPKRPAAAAATKAAVPASAPTDEERALRTRQARRMRFASMQQRVSRPDEIPEAVREELRQHAERMAKLSRIAALAKEKKDARVLARAEKLLARERVRHQATMDRFWPPSPRAAPSAPHDDEPEGEGEAIDPEAEEEEEGVER